MGPDEDHESVSNNVYTNVVAGYALYFAEWVYFHYIEIIINSLIVDIVFAALRRVYAMKVIRIGVRQLPISS